MQCHLATQFHHDTSPSALTFYTFLSGVMDSISKIILSCTCSGKACIWITGVTCSTKMGKFVCKACPRIVLVIALHNSTVREIQQCNSHSYYTYINLYIIIMKHTHVTANTDLPNLHFIYTIQRVKHLKISLHHHHCPPTHTT